MSDTGANPLDTLKRLAELAEKAKKDPTTIKIEFSGRTDKTPTMFFLEAVAPDVILKLKEEVELLYRSHCEVTDLCEKYMGENSKLQALVNDQDIAIDGRQEKIGKLEAENAELRSIPSGKTFDDTNKRLKVENQRFREALEEIAKSVPKGVSCGIAQAALKEKE